LKIGDDSVLFCCRAELKICEKLTQNKCGPAMAKTATMLRDGSDRVRIPLTASSSAQ